jgi:cystathionine beta-lyase/cystathionine gamma-synthase
MAAAVECPGIPQGLTHPPRHHLARRHAGFGQGKRPGITDDLVRVSCGIEGSHDLISDFGQALEKVA